MARRQSDALAEFESMVKDILAQKAQYGTMAEKRLDQAIADMERCRGSEACKRMIEKMREAVSKLAT